MYAMSWERDTREAKYESIQHGYTSIDYVDDASDELSLDELMLNGFDVEIEINEMEME